MKRSSGVRRWFSAAGAAVVVTLVGALGAHASTVTVPTPDSGPTSGGTTVLVPEPPSITFTDIAQGRDHALAVGSDGQLYAWGSNSFGELGTGGAATSAAPVAVLTPAGITLGEPAVSYGWSLAIGSDGSVYSWGRNDRGQLGNGTTTNTTTPATVLTPPGVTFSQPQAGQYTSSALGSDGQVYVWGQPYGTAYTPGGAATVPVATAAPGGATFTRISASNAHILALTSDGVLYAWGQNGFGQLGNGTSTTSTTPVPVAAPAGVTFTEFAVGAYFSLALGSDGVLYSWGNNDSGQLGIGSTTTRNVPTPVSAPAGVTFSDISAGYAAGFATGSDGNTYGWGDNGLWTIGDGTNVRRTTPVVVQSPAGVSLETVASSEERSLAIGSDGKLYAWSYRYGTNVPALFWPQVTVTRVSFDGLDGTSLASAASGDWSVVTPPHAAGPVDVIVEWTLNGVAQPPVTYTSGYTYAEAPTVTTPPDRTTTVGVSAAFTVSATGYPDPALTWEYSPDGGATWLPISDDTAAVVSADGTTLTVTPPDLGHDGRQYRATATSSAGSAVSGAATLTVTPVTNPSGSPSPTGSTSPSPTPTGTTSPSPTPTPTGTTSPSPTPTGTTSPSPTPTPTGTTSPSPTPTDTTSPSPTPTDTTSPSPSSTPTPTNTAGPSPSATSTTTPTPSPTPTDTTSPSPTPTPAGPTSPSATPTGSTSPSATPTSPSTTAPALPPAPARGGGSLPTTGTTSPMGSILGAGVLLLVVGALAAAWRTAPRRHS